MKENTFTIRFLYGTVLGRTILKLVQITGADQGIVRFLRSRWSRPLISWQARKSHIPLTKEQKDSYDSFRDFFARSREKLFIDRTQGHLISPCDGWLSYYPIRKNSSFAIKGSHYQLEDLLHDEELSGNYQGGDCLVFRLGPSDYHHYCYIDDGYQGENHEIEGTLHSVQPIACRKYPVFVLNRRCWSLLDTNHFGPVVQTEIGALVVGGISNDQQNAFFYRGMEKGHFELAGSTIILLFEKGRIHLRPEFDSGIREQREIRVHQGMWIGEQLYNAAQAK